MSNEEMFNLLKRTPIRTDATGLFNYIMEHEKYECFILDMINRYGIIVGKREERRKRRQGDSNV